MLKTQIYLQNNTLDDTFVIITADHGQQFMEHGRHGHGLHLYDELIRVPLIMVGPGLEGQVISRQVSLLDLAPTILDMLEVKKPDAFLGSSLLPLITGKEPEAGSSEAVSETDTGSGIARVRENFKPQLDPRRRRISLRTGSWKYIYTEGEPDELYDLENDPGETQNAIESRPEIAAELLAKITAHIKFEEKSALSEEERVKVKIKIRELKASGKI